MNFAMVLENLIKFCMADILGKLFLPPKIGEMGQKQAKNWFFWI